jgi:phospholipase/carboxylesterase
VQRRVTIVVGGLGVATVFLLAYTLAQDRLQVERVGGDGPPTILLLQGENAVPGQFDPILRGLVFPPSGRFLHPRPGQSWWNLDLSAYRKPGERDADLSNMNATGLVKDAAKVRRTMRAHGNSLHHPFVLVGHSQGAMVASEIAFNSDEPLSALVLLSAAYVDTTGWYQRMDKRKGLPVFIVHGRKDPVFPFAQAEVLARFMDLEGLRVVFIPHDGGHEIPEGLVETLARFLAWARQFHPFAPRLDDDASITMPNLPDFPEGLPTCQPAQAPFPIAGPFLNWVGATVTVRGTLTLSRERGCTLKACASGCCNRCSRQWQIEGAIPSSKALRLRRHLSMGECEHLPTPAIPIQATGIIAMDPSTDFSIADVPNENLLVNAVLCLPEP